MKQTAIRGSSASDIAQSIERLAIGVPEGGEQLPTIRELAASLHVSPVTVAAAYRLLQARGLTVGDRRRGTWLRAQPSPHALPVRRPAVVAGIVDLESGNPDPELLPPVDAAIRELASGTHLYGEPAELKELITFASAEFDADGIPSASVTVTSGALDGVERVLREHLRPGDRVAMEDPTLPAFLDLVGSLGLIAHPCELDDEGIRAEALERALAAHVKALIVTPRAQNPTGSLMTTRRAAELHKLLRRRGPVLLIEVDPLGPVSGEPLVTLATPGLDRWVVVKSTSKFLGPDLRVAVMAGDAMTIARVERRQAIGIRWVSHLLQRLALALWSDPSSGRRLARAADVYAQRRKALIDALQTHGITAHGQSGLNVWIPVREETTTVQALAERGWGVAAGERFRTRSAPAIRVTTSALVPDAARTLADDLAAVLRSRGSALA